MSPNPESKKKNASCIVYQINPKKVKHHFDSFDNIYVKICNIALSHC